MAKMCLHFEVNVKKACIKMLKETYKIPLNMVNNFTEMKTITDMEVIIKKKNSKEWAYLQPFYIRNLEIQSIYDKIHQPPDKNKI